MTTIKIHGYLVRSEDYNHLEFYDSFPKRIYGKYNNHWTYQKSCYVKVLPLEIMPELSWEDEPVEVDLEISVTRKRLNVVQNDGTYKADENTADKVEPKFKVGDWITFYGSNPFKILKVEPEQNGILDYLLLEPSGHDTYYDKKYVDENARLWSIQDAKDGDVLCWDDSKCIALFKKIYNRESFNSYGFVGHCTGTFESGLSYHDIEGAHPATKEQRDLLFQKMKEAGYEWDAEKKELKRNL